jgi:hypothetical protein
MTDSPYPPDYIKPPPSIACAEVDDALIVTMARILGLCWDNKYRRSAPYTPDQLAHLLGRPRTTLYRHLNKLQQLRWLRVDHSARRLVLQPLIRITDGERAVHSRPDQARGECLDQKVRENDQLRAALQEAAIMGRAFRDLLQQDVDPMLVRAWHLWTRAPEQAWMDNPAGYIVNRLREGDEPPEVFLALAQLTPDETAALRRAWAGSEQYSGWPSLDGNDKLRKLAPLWVTIFEALRGYQT